MVGEPSAHELCFRTWLKSQEDHYTYGVVLDNTCQARPRYVAVLFAFRYLLKGVEMSVIRRWRLFCGVCFMYLLPCVRAEDSVISVHSDHSFLIGCLVAVVVLMVLWILTHKILGALAHLRESIHSAEASAQSIVAQATVSAQLMTNQVTSTVTDTTKTAGFLFEGLASAGAMAAAVVLLRRTWAYFHEEQKPREEANGLASKAFDAATIILSIPAFLIGGGWHAVGKLFSQIQGWANMFCVIASGTTELAKLCGQKMWSPVASVFGYFETVVKPVAAIAPALPEAKEEKKSIFTPVSFCSGGMLQELPSSTSSSTSTLVRSMSSMSLSSACMSSSSTSSSSSSVTSSLPIPVTATLQCRYDGDEKKADGTLFCTSDEQSWAHYVRCNFAYYERKASATEKEAWAGLHKLYDKSDAAAHSALDVIAEHQWALKWAFVLCIVLVGIWGLWTQYHGDGKKKKSEKAESASVVVLGHSEPVEEGHGKQKRGNVNKKKRGDHRVNKYWKGIYSKGLEMIVDDSVLQLDDGHGHVYDVNGNSATTKMDDIANHLASSNLNWQSLALKIRMKNGAWKTFDVSRELDQVEVDAEGDSADQYDFDPELEDVLVQEERDRRARRPTVRSSFVEEAKEVKLEGKEAKETKQFAQTAANPRSKLPCFKHYFGRCVRKNCQFSHSMPLSVAKKIMSTVKCPLGHNCKNTDCPFLCVKPHQEMALGKHKLDLTVPLAVTGIVQGVDSKGSPWWTNTTFVGQDFIAPNHWFEKVKDSPGASVGILGHSVRLSECKVRLVDPELVAIRPPSGFFSPSKKVVARIPENEEVYLTAYPTKDATSLAVSQGLATTGTKIAYYSACSQEGDCGGGVWSVKDGTVHLVGLHILGDKTRNGFVPITPELLKRLGDGSVFRPSLL
jgi:hypothetical protein